jgi:hypothetical protein
VQNGPAPRTATRASGEECDIEIGDHVAFGPDVKPGFRPEPCYRRFTIRCLDSP